MWKEHDQNFDAVRIKYINLNSVKSILFTMLESNTIQKQTKLTYKTDLGADSNLIPF